MKSKKYIKFVDTSLEIVQSSRLKLYSYKYSKHVYTQHQLLVLVLWKEYISTDYRYFVELIDLMKDIKERLDLDKISHISLLCKSLYQEFLADSIIPLRQRKRKKVGEKYRKQLSGL